MAGNINNDVIEHTFLNIDTAKMITNGFASWILVYDIYFTNSGIAYVNTVDLKDEILVRDLGSQRGYNLIHQDLASLAKGTRKKMEGLSLKQKLEQNKDSFFLPYLDIQSAFLKRKWYKRVGTMMVKTNEGRWVSEFPLNYLDELRTAMSSHLRDKIVE